MASPASYQVLLLFTPTSTYDVTGDVEEISFDRQLGTFQQKLQVGQGMIRLSNTYGRYTPSNTDSDLAMRLGLGVQVTGVSSGTTDTRLFTGTIDEMGIDVSLDAPRSAIWSLSDNMSLLTKKRFYTTTHSGVCVSSLWSAAFTSVGIPTASQSIAVISDNRGSIALGRTDHAIDDANELLVSGPFTVNLGRDNVAAVWNRYHHNSQSAVNTYTSLWGLEYSVKNEGVINLVNVEYHRLTQNGSIQVYDFSDVTEDEERPFIPSSSWIYIEHNYYDNRWGIDLGDNKTYIKTIVTSPAVQDFTLTTSATGGGTGRTSSGSMFSTLYGWTACHTVFNGHVDNVYLVDFEVRARTLGAEKSGTYIANNIPSQSLYGVQALDLTNNLLVNYNNAGSMASYIVSQYATPALEIGITLRNEYPYALTEDVGTNISVVSSLAGINNKFTIMSSRTRISAGPEGWLHENEYDLREASKV